MTTDFLPGFQTHAHRDGAYRVEARIGGEGPPLLLLHGYPQSHAIWHRVAPGLTDRFQAICPDLPGYGASTGPAPDAENRAYSKRAVAKVLAGLMRDLGHERFGIVGHDRGARVGFRLALDFPERVSGFLSLDTVPTLAVWEAMDWRGAVDTFHWPLLAQPSPFAERLIGADPDFFVRHLLDDWAGHPERLNPLAVAHYLEAFRRPEVVAATSADYRAGATTDVADDEADRAAGKRLRCPVRLVWGEMYAAAGAASPLDCWRDWADEVDGFPLPCGHFIAEEEPERCAAAIRGFFNEG